MWLPKDEECKIPEYATHTVGVGGFVLTENGDVLVVAEKYADRPRAWKLPGGFVKPGEELGQAAEREVFEETGVRAQAISLVSKLRIS